MDGRGSAARFSEQIPIPSTCYAPRRECDCSLFLHATNKRVFGKGTCWYFENKYSLPTELYIAANNAKNNRKIDEFIVPASLWDELLRSHKQFMGCSRLRFDFCIAYHSKSTRPFSKLSCFRKSTVGSRHGFNSDDMINASLAGVSDTSGTQKSLETKIYITYGF